MKALGNIKGTVTSVLKNNWKAIVDYFNDVKVSSNDFKDEVTKIIEEASSTPKQKIIIENIGKKKNKVAVFEYVANVYLAGDGDKVI